MNARMWFLAWRATGESDLGLKGETTFRFVQSLRGAQGVALYLRLLAANDTDPLNPTGAFASYGPRKNPQQQQSHAAQRSGVAFGTQRTRAASAGGGWGLAVRRTTVRPRASTPGAASGRLKHKLKINRASMKRIQRGLGIPRIPSLAKRQSRLEIELVFLDPRPEPL